MDPRRPIARDLTRTAVLAALGRGGPMSRAAIAQELDISAATVTQVTKRLLDQGMLEELHLAPSRGGRPGQLLGLVGSAGRAIGAKVAADHVVIVDVQLDGTVLSSHTVAFDARAAEVPARLATLLRDFVDVESRVPLLGLGVGVPGIVDSPDVGRVEAAVLGWSGIPLGRHLRGALGLPVLVENDVNAVAIAERLYGRGRTRRDFLVLTIGRGVGLAIVIDGALYRGSNGGAGEFGHYPVFEDGPPCACGNNGCLEAFIGDEALVTAGRSGGVLKSRQGSQRLGELADAGDVRALAIYAGAGQLLGRATAALTNVLNPEAIIVLGEGTVAWRHWEVAFRSSLAQHALSTAHPVPIEVEPWDDTSWAQGAAAMVLATPFDLDGYAGDQAELVLARLHREALR
jgi:predicted NBD/HSP70 family sugar kinase